MQRIGSEMKYLKVMTQRLDLIEDQLEGRFNEGKINEQSGS